MKKFYVSYVSSEFVGESCDVSVYDCENLRECLIELLVEFCGEEKEELVGDVQELGTLLKEREDENCGEWKIVSIIEGGDLVYCYN